MTIYQRALEEKQETIGHRRWLHQHAEAGLDLPQTKAYVMQTLVSYGLQPEECGYGVTATLGKGGKCILLRADMDGLPMTEESGLPFACTTGAAHTCGHDFHAAMLLSAAKLLKEQEAQLEGTVKFMFQPAEETFEGAANMIEHGILEDPKPDAALAFHVTSGKMPLGLYMYNDTGTMMASVDGFRIQIQGKGAHGAYPHLSVDPINIGVHIFQALEALMAREANPEKTCVMTIGKFQAGSAPNIIPDTALLEGTIRTNDPDSRALLVRRMQEVAQATAQVYGGSAQVTMTSGVAPLICDKDLTRQICTYIEQLQIPGTHGISGIQANASEDFASIAEKVPAAFMHLSAGFPDERGEWPLHNPKVLFNEDVCPMGTAAFVHCAISWLKDNK